MAVTGFFWDTLSLVWDTQAMRGCMDEEKTASAMYVAPRISKTATDCLKC